MPTTEHAARVGRAPAVPDVPTAEFVHAAPAAPLRRFVVSYSGYREAGGPPGRHRGLPSPFLILILTLGEPLVITAHPNPGVLPSQHDTLVGGLHTVPALITHQGRQSGVQLALTPLGARALLGLPAGELAGATLDAATVLGPVAHRLRERLLAARDWSERFAALDATLLAHLRGDAAVPGAVAHAWQRLLRSGGSVAVAQLADEIGWSTRHLSQRFRAEFGLGPKQVARVVRFDRARRTLARTVSAGSGPTLAAIAADCGYCDQAHLAREFHALAGCSPTRWLAEEFRNVQAIAAVAEAGLVP
ncbi:AraC family transcriptional regulator [Goodfellowiella coeruleoviolacea]|uniref:Helix-turn-helix domain-containing protein n=1 Tax=Goodfellowiella coeruleoviolacea TaxID=334858 RepID=A0AAE3KEU0_9PSEU|nr:AraC family transcriptional regulator [Goodfellowiella coeruleoviolacea]MCP2164180.1 Helix-turn-helix domain-containing protein [Goodfellowiella coeruleoviolacea]